MDSNQRKRPAEPGGDDRPRPIYYDPRTWTEYEKKFEEAGSEGERPRTGPKTGARSDDRIRDELCEAIFRDPEIDASSVEVEVRDGQVHLSGEVRTLFEKFDVENTAAGLRGVTEIHNGLRVRKERSQSVE